MSDQGGDTRIELMFRLETALKRIETLEAALRECEARLRKQTQIERGHSDPTSHTGSAALAEGQDK